MSATHYPLLDKLSRELSGEQNFPTCLKANLLIRDKLSDPFATTEQIAQAIRQEPLIAARLLKVANSPAFYAGGQPSSDLGAAIARLGFETTRTLCLAIAMDQMLKEKQTAVFSEFSYQAWQHTRQMAAIARTLAKRIGRLSPEDALLGGLLDQLGAFYLLYRAAERPEYRNNILHTLDLLIHWHREIGDNLLQLLALPEKIIDAITTPSSPVPDAACTLNDVLNFSRHIAPTKLPWLPAPPAPMDSPAFAQFHAIHDEAEAEIQTWENALAA